MSRQRIYWQWEEIDSITKRIKVYGGWLVRIQHVKNTTVTYVPDKDHNWFVEEPPQEK